MTESPWRLGNQDIEPSRNDAKASLIVITHNSKDTIADSISSITGNLKDLVDELIVVDNASVDGTLEELARLKLLYPNLKVIRESENQGFRKGVNVGMTEAKNNIVIISNPDIFIPDDSVRKCISALDNPKVGLVFPRTILYDSIRGPNPALTSYPTRVVLPFILLYPTYDESTKKPPEWNIPTEVAATAFFVAKKEILLRIGGLDEGIFMNEEEEELAMKIRGMNCQVIFCPSAVAYHLGSASLKKTPERYWLFTFHTYAAGVYLYHKYCIDRTVNRAMWWLIYFTRSVIASMVLRKSYPLRITLQLYIQNKKVRFNQKFNAVWRPALMLSPRLWTWVIKRSSMRLNWL